MTKPENLLIGAHTSAAGGVYNALLEGASIEASCIQFFTSNQRRWDSKPISKEDIAKWKDTLQKTNLSHIMSHDSYLINLGSPKLDVLQKSRDCFFEELERCKSLKISYLNFHPGSALDQSVESCLEKICESLLMAKNLIKDDTTYLLLEATAGQGSCVGHRFEHLDYIIQRVKSDIPIGVCIDTCHIFAAGYDIRDEKSWEKTIEEFDKVVGLKYLKAFHINDSKKGLGSRVDRHADLGQGLIGLECFKFLMKDPRTREIPKYLETPGGKQVWKKEIKMLRGFHAHKN